MEPFLLHRVHLVPSNWFAVEQWDNRSACKSHLWRETCTGLGIKVKKTRPYRPQTNGSVRRFHRTLADGWAFSRAPSPSLRWMPRRCVLTVYCRHAARWFSAGECLLENIVCRGVRPLPI